AHSTGQLTDRELLQRFTSRRDEAAFTTLLQRHGPMVLRACQRVLHHGHDAEDVFQATFLVLARQAGTRRWQPSVANWLYEVACRLAGKARAQTPRRRDHERRVQEKPAADPLVDLSVREAQALLDEELNRLPTRNRAPLVLCYLQGATRDEAAQQLGWSLS